MPESAYYNIVIALIAILLLNLKNRDKYLLAPMSVLVAAAFAIELVVASMTVMFFQIVWILMATGLVLIYYLRLKHRSKIGPAEYFKFIAVLLIAANPINYCGLVYSDRIELQFLAWCAAFIPAVVFVIFVYVKWIFIGENMKTRFVISLVLQFVIIVIAFIFAFFQQTAANRARVQAQENEKVAIETRARGDQEVLKLREELERCRNGSDSLKK